MSAARKLPKAAAAGPRVEVHPAVANELSNIVYAVFDVQALALAIDSHASNLGEMNDIACSARFTELGRLGRIAAELLLDVAERIDMASSGHVAPSDKPEGAAA